MANKRVFYWDLPAHTRVPGNALERRITQALVGTIRVGLQLSAGLEPELTFSTDYQGDDDVRQRTQDYLHIATRKSPSEKTTTISDKFFPLRLCGASMRWIATNLPRPSVITTEFVFKHTLCRVFGFGNLDHMNLLLKTYTPQYSGDTSQLPALQTLIKSWINTPAARRNGTTGQGALAMPVYGQLMIRKEHIDNMVQKLHGFAQNLLTRSSTPVITVTFQDALELLNENKIETIKKGCVIFWLLIADFAEYGIVAQPSLEDLARHMSEKSRSRTSTGPVTSLIRLSEWVGLDTPRMRSDILSVLTTCWNTITDPNSPHQDIRQIQAESAIAQGRPLNVIDLEHLLCKISCQISKTKMYKKPETEEEKQAKVDKKAANKAAKLSTKRELENVIQESEDDTDTDTAAEGEGEGSRSRKRASLIAEEYNNDDKKPEIAPIPKKRKRESARNIVPNLAPNPSYAFRIDQDLVFASASPRNLAHAPAPYQILAVDPNQHIDPQLLDMPAYPTYQPPYAQAQPVMMDFELDNHSSVQPNQAYQAPHQQYQQQYEPVYRPTYQRSRQPQLRQGQVQVQQAPMVPYAGASYGPSGFINGYGQYIPYSEEDAEYEVVGENEGWNDESWSHPDFNQYQG